MSRKLFEFKCPHCGHYQESLVADPIAGAPACPNNHGLMLKIISTPSFNFQNGAGTSSGLMWSIPGVPRLHL